ncbi:MAG: hypothetical protein VX642_00705, partial [Bdellovibrionota bacterium]|nr:hypothetical protein [Bdellovibrionota bacterium]
KTLKSMLNLIDRQKTVQKESYIFFKAILKIWETEEIHMDDSLLSILRSSLLVKSLDKLDKVFFEIQRVLVMSNRYTVLKNFERLYRLPSHPSNSVISIQNSSVGASSFYLELVAGWVASSFSVYQNDIRDTVNIYFKNKIDSLNTDTNLIESVLEEHLLEKDYKKALAKTVDMVETTRYSDISLDIKFLIDSLIRAESLGRNIELKLAILLLKDAEFMSLYGSKFIEFILLAHGYDIKNNSPITKLSNFANAKKILDTIKSKIKKEYSWSDYKGPWSITSVNKILGPFYTYRPNSIVKAIGHNLKARVLVNTAKRLLANKKARTNGKDRPSIGSDQSCKNSSRK